ncbi:MAG: hypothetical protein AB7P31_12795 [Steroidobacteraceae bacterium]
MNNFCRCKFCTDNKIQFWKLPDEQLIDLASTTDDRHRFMRVYAFIELLYRAGVFSPAMPYIVWRHVMGPNIPPPVSATSFGAFPSRLQTGSTDWARGYH